MGSILMGGFVLTLLAGGVVFGLSFRTNSAIHEIEALLLGVMSTLFLCTYAVLSRLDQRSDATRPQAALSSTGPRESVPPVLRSYEHPLSQLSPTETLEANRCLDILSHAGYALQTRQKDVWEVRAPHGGQIFFYNLEQLQRYAGNIETSS